MGAEIVIYYKKKDVAGMGRLHNYIYDHDRTEDQNREYIAQVQAEIIQKFLIYYNKAEEAEEQREILHDLLDTMLKIGRTQALLWVVDDQSDLHAELSI